MVVTKKFKSTMALLSKRIKATMAPKSRTKKRRAFSIKGQHKKVGRKVVHHEKKKKVNLDKDLNEKKYTIFVETWTSKWLELQVNGSTTINEIKDMIFIEEETPQDRQIVLFVGQELEDQCSLEHYGVGDKSLLHQSFKRYVLNNILED